MHDQINNIAVVLMGLVAAAIGHLFDVLDGHNYATQNK